MDVDLMSRGACQYRSKIYQQKQKPLEALIGPWELLVAQYLQNCCHWGRSDFFCNTMVAAQQGLQSVVETAQEGAGSPVRALLSLDTAERLKEPETGHAPNTAPTALAMPSPVQGRQLVSSDPPQQSLLHHPLQSIRYRLLKVKPY